MWVQGSWLLPNEPSSVKAGLAPLKGRLSALDKGAARAVAEEAAQAAAQPEHQAAADVREGSTLQLRCATNHSMTSGAVHHLWRPAHLGRGLDAGTKSARE